MTSYVPRFTTQLWLSFKFAQLVPSLSSKIKKTCLPLEFGWQEVTATQSKTHWEQ